MEVTNRLFCRVILTSKNEKFLESSVSKVNSKSKEHLKLFANYLNSKHTNIKFAFI